MVVRQRRRTIKDPTCQQRQAAEASWHCHQAGRPFWPRWGSPLTLQTGKYWAEPYQRIRKYETTAWRIKLGAYAFRSPTGNTANEATATPSHSDTSAHYQRCTWRRVFKGAD